MLRRYLVLLPVGFDRSLFVSSSAVQVCMFNVMRVVSVEDEE